MYLVSIANNLSKSVCPDSYIHKSLQFYSYKNPNFCRNWEILVKLRNTKIIGSAEFFLTRKNNEKVWLFTEFRKFLLFFFKNCSFFAIYTPILPIFLKKLILFKIIFKIFLKLRNFDETQRIFLETENNFCETETQYCRNSRIRNL